MKQTRRILPIYTSDVSGVCSALYELGGMVVMHDPSGCNSTYNTHDEIRWYDKDSLIFISGLTERDAVMGNDEKFYQDVLQTAQELGPSFIAITNSPIPYLMGTDFPALVKRLERETGIPSFYVPANGMHDYTVGAGRAFEKAAWRLVDPAGGTIPQSVNLLGLTPLDYAASGSAAAIRGVFEDAGLQVISSWAMEDGADGRIAYSTHETVMSVRTESADGAGDSGITGDLCGRIRRAGEASVNVVVSSVGLRAARVLYQRFGTPCVIGTPVGLFSERLLDAVGNVLRDPASWTPEEAAVYRRVPAERKLENEPRYMQPVILVGEPVIMGSLAAAIRLETGRETQVICPTETTQGLLREGKNSQDAACAAAETVWGPRADQAVHGEEETQQALQSAACIIADPMYRLISPPDAVFYSFPTLALSGRSYLKEIRSDWIGEEGVLPLRDELMP